MERNGLFPLVGINMVFSLLRRANRPNLSFLLTKMYKIDSYYLTLKIIITDTKRANNDASSAKAKCSTAPRYLRLKIFDARMRFPCLAAQCSQKCCSLTDFCINSCRYIVAIEATIRALCR